MSYNQISGERFTVIYRLTGGEKESYAKAQDICLEQTVEFPGELVPEGMIREHVVGKIEKFEPCGEGCFRAAISFAIETVAYELTQLLNVVFGNISIKPGYYVESLQLPNSILKTFKGPRFGRQGMRNWLGIPDRPLLFTALKPMGLSAKELADLAYKFALGGIDIIKDDHGLTNQNFAPFDERVKLCVEAIEKANNETGNKCIYVANITAPATDIITRAKIARDAGAKGLMLAPGITGYDIMRQVADDDSIALPMISHPAFQGSYVTSASGISHYALFGQIARLAGADATVYPNFGGRFLFSREECSNIAEGTVVDMAHIKSIFPAPGGGMSLQSIPDMLQVYGKEVIFLIGGGLFRQGSNLVENCKYFRELVEKF